MAAGGGGDRMVLTAINPNPGRASSLGRGYCSFLHGSGVTGPLPRLEGVVAVFTEMAETANVSSIYLAPVLKAIAVAYITSFGVQLSREAGEETIATTIELAGKVVILLVAVPLIQAIFSTLLALLDY